MKAPSSDYEVVETADGSKTLFSKKYNEACHSLGGAREETKLHYLAACEVGEKLKKQEVVRILEVGFGTGIGFLETYALYKKQRVNSNAKLEFVSLEIDPVLVNSFYEREQDEYPELKVIVGDARVTIKDIVGEFDCIYQDAFSPRRNPDLWTVEWFNELSRLSKSETVMSTYSASTRVRKSMLEAGWRLFPGAMFGQKRTATIAKRDIESDKELITKLSQSSVGALYDNEIDQYKKL